MHIMHISLQKNDLLVFLKIEIIIKFNNLVFVFLKKVN